MTTSPDYVSKCKHCDDRITRTHHSRDWHGDAGDTCEQSPTGRHQWTGSYTPQPAHVTQLVATLDDGIEWLVDRYIGKCEQLAGHPYGDEIVTLAHGTPGEQYQAVSVDEQCTDDCPACAAIELRDAKLARAADAERLTTLAGTPRTHKR